MRIATTARHGRRVIPIGIGGRTPPASHSRMLADIRSRPLHLLSPIVLVLIVIATFRAAIAMFGEHTGQLAGFGVYWLLGGLVFPLLILGGSGYAELFAPRHVQWTKPLRVAAALLAVPAAFGFLFVFPYLFPMDDFQVLAAVAAYALVNGTLEEVFWRGTFATAFKTNPWLGVVYPAMAFGIWQLVPWMFFPTWPLVPALVVFGVAFGVGLLYNWVAWRTGTIRWTAISHVLTNLSGIGALLVFMA